MVPLPRPFLLVVSVFACTLPPRLTFHAIPRDLGSGTVEPVCLWLESSAELERHGLVLADVDWAREDVVVLSLGQQGTTGHAMQLNSIRLDSSGTIIFDTTHAFPTSAVGEALTHPGLMVRLEKGHGARRRALRLDGVLATCAWQ